MALLSGIAIAKHAATAGFRGNDLVISIAVALASSLGNDSQEGGLWHQAGAPANDPAGQARAAYARWKAGGWKQWPAYTSGRYLLMMPGAAASAGAKEVLDIIGQAGEAAQGAIDTGKDMLDAAQNAVGALQKAGVWLSKRENWIRVAQVTIGGAMIIAAVAMITRPQRALTGVSGMIIKPIVKGAIGKGEGE